MTVFVVSHHEGVIAVAATQELADRIIDGFVSKYGHTFGAPWAEEFTVQDEEVDQWRC